MGHFCSSLNTSVSSFVFSVRFCVPSHAICHSLEGHRRFHLWAPSPSFVRVCVCHIHLQWTPATNSSWVIGRALRVCSFAAVLDSPDSDVLGGSYWIHNMERASKPPVWPPGDTTQPQCTAQLKQSSDEMTRMEIHTSRSFLPGTLRCWIDHHLGLTSVPSVTNSKAGIDGQQSILLGGHSTSGIPATYVWGESIVA